MNTHAHTNARIQSKDKHLETHTHTVRYEDTHGHTNGYQHPDTQTDENTRTQTYGHKNTNTHTDTPFHIYTSARAHVCARWYAYVWLAYWALFLLHFVSKEAEEAKASFQGQQQ